MISREKLLPSIKINIETENKYETFLFLGDLHLGHCNFNEKKFNKTMQWAKENGAYFIYMGDMMECGINLKYGIPQFEEQILTVEEQYEVLVKTFKPFAEKNLIFLMGNHEFRAMRYAGIDIAKHLANDIGAIYAGYGTIFQLGFNDKVNYNIVVHHGNSMSQYPQYELNKLDKVFTGYDLMAVGHIHQLFHDMPQSLRLDKDGEIDAHTRHRIRTGSFVKYPPYAFRKTYPVTKNGCPVVYLGTEEKDIHVDNSGVGVFNGIRTSTDTVVHEDGEHQSL